MLCSFIYNRCSKWGSIPRIIPEIALALSITLLCLTGTFVVSADLQAMHILFGAVIGVVLLFVNSIPSGIKDIDTDAIYGARSFVLSTGSYATDDGTLFLSRRLRLYADSWDRGLARYYHAGANGVCGASCTADAHYHYPYTI